MRVLWFTNCLIEQACTAFGQPQAYYGGGWMGALLSAVQQRCPDIEFCVATAGGKTSHVKAEGVEFVLLPSRNLLRHAADLVREQRPDVIHIHGSEGIYGLLGESPEFQTKTLVSLQGLVEPCARWSAYFGTCTPWEVLRLHRIPELMVGRGVLLGYFAFRRQIARERRILGSVGHIAGRTSWDRAYTYSLNPSARYHYLGELLREPFWRGRWRIERCRRNSIIFTNAGHPRKGVEHLLDAVKILRHRYPDAVVRIAGAISERSGYGRHVRKLVERTGAVELLGSLDAKQMASSLIGSHVFVSPSFIDNSCNSLCEAQLLGMPVVSTYVGGIPSLVEDGRTGLFCNAGDAASIAAAIDRIFADDSMAERLGSAAHDVARARHDADTVVGQLVAAYATIASECKVDA